MKGLLSWEVNCLRWKLLENWGLIEAGRHDKCRWSPSWCQHTKEASNNPLVTRKQGRICNSRNLESGDIAVLGYAQIKECPVPCYGLGMANLPGSPPGRIWFKESFSKRKPVYHFFFFKMTIAWSFRSNNPSRGVDKGCSTCECQSLPFPCLVFNSEGGKWVSEPLTLFSF